MLQERVDMELKVKVEVELGNGILEGELRLQDQEGAMRCLVGPS